MDSSEPNSASPSRSSTPNAAGSGRFTGQKATAEDLLKSQTVGLVQLSDFRKRRAEAQEQTEREAHDRIYGRVGSKNSGNSTPRDGSSTPLPVKKRIRKNPAKGKLSFAGDDEDETSSASANPTPRSASPNIAPETLISSDKDAEKPKKRLGPNSGVAFTPKAMTKSSLLKEAQTREQLRKEFLIMQEAVKATEIVIPFVYYDGTNIPGGVCRVKKGNHIWFFLDKARKLRAEQGVGSQKGRRGWARVSVDDLLLVRGQIIIPHRYEFYYFIVNKSVGFNGPMFNYSAEPTAATPKEALDPTQDPDYDPLEAGKKKDKSSPLPDRDLEGFGDDPNITKVVDRRWYERNKHIFPASVWEEFDPEKDYTKGIRKDASGNAFFFS